MIARAIKIIFFVLAVSSIPWATNAATVAPVPPMGWNSWDAYGTTVREEEVKANADYMAKYLAKYGWQYIVVDIEWYTPKPKTHGYIPDPSNVTLDRYGRLIPAVGRFPSSADGSGFTHLAAYIHSKGLKFGIHIMRGIPREAVTAQFAHSRYLLHGGRRGRYVQRLQMGREWWTCSGSTPSTPAARPTTTPS